jgi:hypothetical protein
MDIATVKQTFTDAADFMTKKFNCVSTHVLLSGNLVKGFSEKVGCTKITGL